MDNFKGCLLFICLWIVCALILNLFIGHAVASIIFGLIAAIAVGYFMTKN